VLRAALAALAPVLAGSAPLAWQPWLTMAFLLEARARDALGDPRAADQALERALDCAEPDGALLFFLWHPAPGLLQRHTRDCARHAAMVAEILSLLSAGNREREQPGPGGMASSHARRNDPGEWPPRLIDPLTKSEIRLLRYLPTNLSAPEIARELSVSVNTVKTHIRHVSAKLGAHGRTEAVAQARGLGLLAPSPRTPR
jgi:LuxR family transcriptional regulator, maltose regulon positive regulatory protein